MDNPEQTPHLTPPHLVEEEPPPLLRSWGQVYAVVVCYLAFLIALFYFFSRSFVS
jgi:hypothetical protein